MTKEKIMENIWPGLAVVAALIAWLTNPTLEAHQTAARAMIQQARDNACSAGDVAACGYLLYYDAIRSGTFSNDYVMSRYVVSVDGSPFLTCTGFFGQVSCKSAGK